MHAIFRMHGNESQPDIEPAKKAGYTPGWKEYVGETARTFGVHFQFRDQKDGRHPTSSAIQEHTKATVWPQVLTR